MASEKQAVLLIHGIGEQRPMDTLRGFVHALWTTDERVKHEHARPGIWSKPDDISGSYELRRLTTSKNRNGVRADFFELYWAHRMAGTTIGHVLAWARRLVLRPPWRVPRALLGAWWLVVVLMVLALAFAVVTLLPEAMRPFEIPRWLSALLGAVSAYLVLPVVRRILGDAARYLDPAPANIHRRQEIRAAAVEILNALHDAKNEDGSARYSRILVVGHSLGSVIGYDMLTYAWPPYADEIAPSTPSPVLDEIERLLQTKPLDTEAYRVLQRRLFDEDRERGSTWRVTDFVTIGSPLAHAMLLLADDESDLRQKQTERELPTCPPVLEEGRMSYAPTRSKPDQRTLHHAAVFGPTRWTNVYAPARLIVRGDLIGGPLQSVFGHGIHDVVVRPALWGGFLSHTHYWTPENADPPGAHIQALRETVNLADDISTIP